MKRWVGVAGLCVLSLTLHPLASTPSQNPESINIEAVIRKFWRSIGDADVEALKQKIDYPFTIIEISQQTNPATIIHTPAELESEFKKGQPHPGKKKNEFLDLRFANIKMEMVNQNLASVTYNLSRVKTGLNTSKNSEPVFSILTVLRRDAQSNSWKIVFTYIPK